MYRENGIIFTQCPAGVDDFLRASLHFRIAALYRIKIQICGIGARCHGGCGTTTHADAHARAAKLYQQAAGRQAFFLCMLRGDVTHTAGDHDRLVIAVNGATDILFVGAEITRQIRTTEFIVECCATERAINHDLQG